MSDHSSNNSDSSYESDSDTSSDENNNNYDECGCINSMYRDVAVKNAILMVI